MPEKKKYWFPAEPIPRGPSFFPAGWHVFVVYFGLLVLDFRRLRLLANLIISWPLSDLSSLLFALCRLKGEPPKWRWSKRQSCLGVDGALRRKRWSESLEYAKGFQPQSSPSIHLENPCYNVGKKQGVSCLHSAKGNR